MVQNLTGIVATNVTASTPTSQFFNQNLAAIIASIALLLALISILYKFGQQVGEIKGIKQVIEAKLESIDEKYNTSEKIQRIELDIQKLEIKKSNKDDVNDYLSTLTKELIGLKKQNDYVDEILKIIVDEKIKKNK